MDRSTGATIFMFLLVMAGVALIHVGALNCEAQESAMGLSQLSTVEISGNSTASADLLSQAFWSEVEASSKQTFQQMIPQTIAGFLNSSQDWRDWLENESESPPPWLGLGLQPELNSEVLSLGSAVVGARTAQQAAATVQSYAQSASSYTLAALDYPSLNGLTALRTYTSTGSLDEAVCISFPAQLAQLYTDSTDPTLPSPLRAQYLGQAIAVTEMTVLLSGTDGLSTELSEALSKAGLSASWDTIRPYLSDIGTRVSAKASFLTLMLSEELATRFPQNSVWVTGLTTERVDLMVEGLQEEGDSDTQIEHQISNLVQAAGDAPDEDSVAIDADTVRYEAGAGLVVQVGSQNRMFEYTEGEAVQTIQASFLQQVVPGFRVGQDCVLEVAYVENGVTVYHAYNGGSNWIPTAPNDLAEPGDIITLKFRVLTMADFVANLESIPLVNDIGLDWVSQRTTVGSFTLNGNTLGMTLFQDPEVGGVPDFTLQGTLSPTIGFIRGDAYLQFGVQDIFGNTRLMRIYSDGYSPAYFGIKASNPFLEVAFMSYDGVRLKVAYDAGNAITQYKVATIYESNPSALYSFGGVQNTNLPVKTVGVLNAFQIDSVTFNRPLEGAMFEGGVPYDLARIGVEIAYKVGSENLGINDLVINEPSQVGPDLISEDGTVVMQARFLKVTNLYSEQQLEDALQQNLQDMNVELKYDFRLYHSQLGVIVLSYVSGSGVVNTIVIEVQGPS